MILTTRTVAAPAYSATTICPRMAFRCEPIPAITSNPAQRSRAHGSTGGDDNGQLASRIFSIDLGYGVDDTQDDQGQGEYASRFRLGPHPR